jgi:ribose 5-phosphate isomerase B
MTTCELAIASEHTGFDLKTELIEYIKSKPISLKDLGPYSFAKVDYPDYGKRLSEALLDGECSRGILICGNGIGMSIVANRCSGIRAALCTNKSMAHYARAHNNANVLVLGSRNHSYERAKEILDVFLTQRFEGGRHSERLKKIS